MLKVAHSDDAKTAFLADIFRGALTVDHLGNRVSGCNLQVGWVVAWDRWLVTLGGGPLSAGVKLLCPGASRPLASLST